MSQLKNILIAAPVSTVQASILKCFGSDYSVDSAYDVNTSLDYYRQKHYEFVFLDLQVFMPAGKHISLTSAILDPYLAISRDPEIVILCPPENVRSAVQIVRDGANSYLIHPIDPSEIKYVIDTTYEYRKVRLELGVLQDEFWQGEVQKVIKTQSPLMQEVYKAAKLVAGTHCTVLLTGETGTGKGVLAKLIHQHSARKEKPFVSVHCGAIHQNLIESELFGHEKGAFTGAFNRRLGKFEIARGGTIFLDEIGTMPLESQIKLLKVLQERVFQRVGGEKDIEADVRVITATNADLQKMSETGKFRSDLYYRLKVYPIEIPPLRERKCDIPHLAQIFLQWLNNTYGKNITGIHRLVFKGFEHYSWPGNIRELENLLEHAYIRETSGLLTPESFPKDVVPIEKYTPVVVLDTEPTLAAARQKAVTEIEEAYIRKKLSLFHGRIDKAAAAAGVTPRQLHKIMTKYSLRKESFM